MRLSIQLHLFEDYLTAPVMAIMTFPAVVWAFMVVLWFGIIDYLVHVIVLAYLILFIVVVLTIEYAVLKPLETYFFRWRD